MSLSKGSREKCICVFYVANLHKQQVDIISSSEEFLRIRINQIIIVFNCRIRFIFLLLGCFIVNIY